MQITSSRLGGVRSILLTVLSLFLLHPAGAVEVTSLYTAEVPFDRSAANPREEAYRLALYDVLLRVSGGALANDRDLVQTLFPTPAAYVVQFSPGAEDTLLVTFDGEAVENALKSAGQTVWGSDRPLTLVWLAVDWGGGEREILGIDNPLREEDDARSIDRNQLLRERILALAERHGLPLLLPLLDAEDLEKVSYTDIRGGFDEVVLDASQRYEAASVLIGVVDAGASQPNRWRHYLGSGQRDWRGEPEQVIPAVAELLAAEFAIRGDVPVRAVRLTVAGVQTVDAYGDLQQRLGGIELIERLVVEEVEGDRITYRAEVRGGGARLAKALRFAGLLESERLDSGMDDGRGFPIDNPVETLQFFYEPR
ncbi:MAG: DUF2066 domain-containing protein [Pseudomonadota bacterium]